jgi:hypothetical protein
MMKFFILVTLGVLALGGWYHEDLTRSFSKGSGGAQISIPVVKSAGNLGAAMNRNMDNIGRSLGQ